MRNSVITTKLCHPLLDNQYQKTKKQKPKKKKKKNHNGRHDFHQQPSLIFTMMVHYKTRRFEAAFF